MKGKEKKFTTNDMGITPMHVQLNNILYTQMLIDAEMEKKIKYEIQKPKK